MPYALLLLEWEARFPDEWPRWWGTKKKVIRAFCQLPDEYPREVRARLMALVVQAVCRDHRCEDAGYARLGRYVADDDLVGYLWAISETASRESIRHRAAFVLHLIRQPQLPVTRATWTAWRKIQAS